MLLNRKGNLYLFGEISKDSTEKFYLETPREIENISSISSIYSTLSGFFAVSENKMVWGWGNNSESQITGLPGNEFIPSPALLRIPIYLGESIKIIGGPNTTYLLSNRALDTEY